MVHVERGGEARRQQKSGPPIDDHDCICFLRTRFSTIFLEIMLTVRTGP